MDEQPGPKMCVEINFLQQALCSLPKRCEVVKVDSVSDAVKTRH
mgnify:FL=1